MGAHYPLHFARFYRFSSRAKVADAAKWREGTQSESLGNCECSSKFKVGKYLSQKMRKMKM